MSNINNISLYENGSGGDFEFVGNDIQMTGALWTMVYIALFGGNPNNSTKQTKVGEFNKDYWANNLLYPNNTEKQVNSEFENTIRNNALSSANLTLFERVAIEDLKSIDYVGKFYVNCYIESEDRLRTIINVVKQDGSTENAEIIWNATVIESIGDENKPESDWILQTGFWNDEGKWYDNAIWE